MSTPPQHDLPVLVPTARPLDRDAASELGAARLDALARALPTAQTAAVAAGGFVAGAALVRLTHRRRVRALARTPRRRRRSILRPARARRDAARSGSVLEIVASRSLLVDVHLLAGRE